MNNIPARLTRHYAETRGYTVDTHCYPWIAYKGDRFDPARMFPVYTDIEAEFLAAKCGDALAERMKRVSFFVDEMNPVQVELKKGSGNVGRLFLAVRAHLETAIKQCEHLQNYAVHDWKYDGDFGGMACLTANLWRSVGDYKNELVSEIAVSFTAKSASVQISTYQVGLCTLGLFDNTTQSRLELPLEVLPFDGMMYIATEEAGKQLAYALARQERMPTVS